MKRALMAFLALAVFAQKPAYPAKTISGWVTDGYGKVAAPGVRVIALEQSGTNLTFETSVDATGAYSMEVTEGLYVVAVNTNATNSSYVSQYYSGVNAIDYAEYLDLTSADAGDINFYLWAGYKLSGQIQGDFDPASTHSFYIYDNHSWEIYDDVLGPALDLQTGRFSLNADQGIYHILFYGNNYSTFGNAFSIALFDDVSDLTVTAHYNGKIKGIISDFSGNPFGYAIVTAIDAQNGYYLGYTDVVESDGYYEISDLPGGVEYLVMAAVLPDYGYCSATFYPNSILPEQASRVYVGPGATVSGVDIILSNQLCSVSGVVTDESGSPIAEALVYDFYISPSLNSIYPYCQRLVYTDASGNFILDGLAPVTMGIAVIATDYIPEIWNDHLQTTTLAAADPIEPANGQAIEGINFTLRSTSSLGNAPSITSVSPHLLYPGFYGAVTIVGTHFSMNGLVVEILDESYLHTNGVECEIVGLSVIDPTQITVTLSVQSHATPQAIYLGATNPDGQYDTVGLSILPLIRGPEIGVIAAPDSLTSDCTITIALNLTNVAPTSMLIDAYFGLILPDGSAFYFTGMDFSSIFTPLVENYELIRDFYIGASTMLTVPIEIALPPGTYTWFGALLEAGTMNLVDLSLREQQY